MEEQQEVTAAPQEQTQMPLKPHRGVLILVLGILGIVCCFILGIIAWVMGNGDLREIDAGRMDPSGRGLTQAGKICGMVGVILWIIYIVINIIMVLLGGGAMFFSASRGM
jgi:hypothetical protein